MRNFISIGLRIAKSICIVMDVTFQLQTEKHIYVHYICIWICLIYNKIYTQFCSVCFVILAIKIFRIIIHPYSFALLYWRGSTHMALQKSAKSFWRIYMYMDASVTDINSAPQCVVSVRNSWDVKYVSCWEIYFGTIRPVVLQTCMSSSSSVIQGDMRRFRLDSGCPCNGETVLAV